MTSKDCVESQAYERARVNLATRNMADRVRHKKTGNIYCVIGVCINCTNGEHDGETMVLYHPEYSGLSGPLYVRSVDEFLEKFEACD